MQIDIVSLITIFILAVFVGNEIINKVPPTLHTPLMSGSNAISGITLIAGILIYPNVVDDVLLKTIVLIGVAFATMNIVGGFSVTGRILEMFKKND